MMTWLLSMRLALVAAATTLMFVGTNSSVCAEHHATTEHHAVGEKQASGEHHTIEHKTTEIHNGNHHVVVEHKTKECKISCVDPHAACDESAKVIDTLRMLFDAVHKGDFETMSAYMDDGVTTFDEGTKKLIVGKEAVLADLRKKFEINKALGLESLTIDTPYAKVTGNTAVVTFVAVKVFGGKKPARMESRSTDIFVKEGGKWKKMHYRSNWKKVS